MAQLILYRERGREYIVITSDDPTDEEFEEEYAATPLVRAEILDDVSCFPTDRGLSE
ncbi:hypothetical protein LCGC14_2360340 [marine sediment metagenome]|uniref:Uncharacterized protein n=1 Tax=marine sediment metagenome TaxID=412755 RepID=A0A0F9CU29_9ZZZZ